MAKTERWYNNLNEYVCWDLETTGLGANCEITQIGASKVKNGEIIARFSRYIKINREIPEEVVEFNGITKELLDEEGVPLEDALMDFKDFCEGSPMIAHNGKNFDSRILNYASCDNHIYFHNNRIDSLIIAQWLISPISCSLDNVARFYHIDVDNNSLHHADYDAELLAKLMIYIFANCSLNEVIRNSTY